jgi:hypothetical protein
MCYLGCKNNQNVQLQQQAQHQIPNTLRLLEYTNCTCFVSPLQGSDLYHSRIADFKLTATMRLFVCVCVCTCVHESIFVYACARACLCACLCVCLCMYVCMSVCLFVNVCGHVWACECATTLMVFWHHMQRIWCVGAGSQHTDSLGCCYKCICCRHGAGQKLHRVHGEQAEPVV